MMGGPLGKLGLRGSAVATAVGAGLLYYDFAYWSPNLVIISKHVDRMVLMLFIGMCLFQTYWLYTANGSELAKEVEL